MLTITAVVNAYNSGPFIREAVESVLAQTRPADEILVIDDGSTDDTAAQLAGLDPRATYLWQENRGVCASRNRGCEMARSNWIAYLDGDDVWLPNRLEVQAAWIAQHPETEAVFGLAQNFAHPGRERLFSVEKHHLNEWRPGWLPSAMLVRRDTMLRTNGFDVGQRATEMLDWFIRSREAGVAMTMLDVPVLRRRLHGANAGLKEQRPKVDLPVLRNLINRRRAARQDVRNIS